MSVPCPTCGEEFSEHGLKRHHPRSHGESLVTKMSICEWCGEEFEYLPSDGEGRYCSKECWSQHQNSQREVEVSQFECETCDETFELKTYYPSEGKYCSVECRAQDRVGVDLISEEAKARMSESRLGQDNPNWSGGSSDLYPPGWREAREQARKRDNHRCVLCGLTNEEHREKWGDLPVHHMVPRRYFYRDGKWLPGVNDLSNLVTLCKPCHMEQEAIINRESVTEQDVSLDPYREDTEEHPNL